MSADLRPNPALRSLVDDVGGDMVHGGHFGRELLGPSGLRCHDPEDAVRVNQLLIVDLCGALGGNRETRHAVRGKRAERCRGDNDGQGRREPGQP